MKIQNLNVNQLSADVYRNYLSYLKAMDEKDIETYGKFLADDVEMWFNNEQFGIGKETILKGLGEYWQSFVSIEHDLTNIYGTDKNYVLEALNHYKRHDGRDATVKAVAFTDLNYNGKVKSVRLYMDMAPIFK
ncbi:nuclear transport factor 2 family protein [Flagellimonas allohymeniacidonis]|uniref:Nuclear transport factor 2 family protein n=1 Tax=Flagellimonas allohymeniacidonis TaxID=2517819 RepID=A0A4Q8QBY7_9FLAO|nr:nuclear transport factor 2 family protein [Allomuricauda hymeniacidonis]TAI47831.1 nuclear transport factor 2 family protein [Allomuricauda hymeniacidonis]